MGINEDIIRDVFYALCKIHYYEPQESQPIPDDEDITDEMKEKINEGNEEIERANELNVKMKAFVKLVTPQPEEEKAAEDAGEQVSIEPEEEEKCLVRL